VVRISFKMVDKRCCQLRIADNGIGLPEGIEPESSRSLGMSLMTGLSTQLMGDLKLYNENGLVLEVGFLRNNELHKQNTLN